MTEEHKKEVPSPTTTGNTQHVISLLSESDGEVSSASETDVEADVDELFNSDDGEEDDSKKDV